MCFSRLRIAKLFLVILIGTMPAQLTATDIQPCGKESTRTGQTFKGSGSDIFIRTGPGEKFGKIINQKATSILGKTQFISIDNSVTVYEECTQSGWSKINVTDPDWLRESHKGWVPSKTLRQQMKNPKGVEVFTEQDFIWDKKTSLYKKIIMAGVNKIHRENSQCKDIDPTTAYISGNKGTKSDPVFFVTCGKGAGAFNVFFSKSEVEKGKEFKAASHIDQVKAVDYCEAYAKDKATHPSTVDFSRVLDLNILEHPNGRTTVTSSFTAKNSFNLKLKYRIKCLLDSSGIIEANIWEDK
jgi:hypothetical protein